MDLSQPLEITILDDGILISNTASIRQYLTNEQELRDIITKINQALLNPPYLLDLPWPCVIHDKRTTVIYPEGVLWQKEAERQRLRRYKPR